MSAKYYRPPDSARITVNTDILDDLPQRQAREALVHQVAKKSRNANNVNPIYMDVFQKLRTGRRCSCWTFEDSAHGNCPICFGVGIVGGYQKMRTKQVIFDVTYPNVKSVNVEPDYETSTRPVFWTLSKSATNGYIEFRIPITSNSGRLDVLYLMDHIPTGSSIKYLVKTSSEIDYVDMNEKSIEERLGFSELDVRIEMKRKNPSIKLPKLVGIRLAYRIRSITAYRANVPRTNESRILDEFGIYESFTQQRFFFDNEVKMLTSQDFMINLHDKTRWSIVELENNKPFGVITSWDATARLVQRFERYAKIPAGSTDTEFMPPEFIRSIQTDQELMDHLQIVRNNSTFGRTPGNRVEFVDDRIGHKNIRIEDFTNGPIREV